MLAHTMDKLQRNTSRTPRKVKSNIMNVQNMPLQTQLSRGDLRTGYNPSSSTTNLQASRVPTNLPTRRQVLQGDFGRSGQFYHSNNIQYERQGQSPNNTLIKNKSENITIPPFRQNETQESWQSKMSGTLHQQFVIESQRRTINPFEMVSETERSPVSLKNDIRTEYYQK